ncbi:MAG: hypothetical protein KF729_14495 [Sandaracinaceae bacterium]|nr:hypothetical protein [Sandaracinaceae bacterium]
MRRMWCLAFAAAMGCGGETTDVDAGTARDAGDGMDAGAEDAGFDASVDAGFDASASDAGSDAAMPDAGPEPEWPEPGLGSPAWATLTVGEPGTCTPLVACGGDVVGTWDVSGGCFEVALEERVSMCPGAMVSRREGRGRGRVVFGADGAARRVAEAIVEVEIFVPALCAAFVSCAMIESMIRPAVTEASCPVDAMGNCNCMARQRTLIDDTDLYTTEGDEIVSTTSGKRWEYCVEADGLRYQDTSPTGTREPGIVELTRR